jgi:hypothetical protein
LLVYNITEGENDKGISDRSIYLERNFRSKSNVVAILLMRKRSCVVP